MSKVNGIANTCAGIVGGGVVYFAQDINQEQIQQAVLSLIPPLTLLLAYLFKIAGNMAALSVFDKLLNSSAIDALDDISEALKDEHLSVEAKESLKIDYEETYLIKLSSKKHNLNTLNKASQRARTTLSKNLQKGYQDNPDLKNTN
jgi:hypothetical protein